MRRIDQRRDETVSEPLREAVHIIVQIDREERDRNVSSQGPLVARTTRRGRQG